MDTRILQKSREALEQLEKDTAAVKKFIDKCEKIATKSIKNKKSAPIEVRDNPKPIGSDILEETNTREFGFGGLSGYYKSIIETQPLRHVREQDLLMKDMSRYGYLPRNYESYILTCLEMISLCVIDLFHKIKLHYIDNDKRAFIDIYSREDMISGCTVISIRMRSWDDQLFTSSVHIPQKLMFI